MGSESSARVSHVFKPFTLALDSDPIHPEVEILFFNGETIKQTGTAGCFEIFLAAAT
jgi:hypothetical protein